MLTLEWNLGKANYFCARRIFKLIRQNKPSVLGMNPVWTDCTNF